MLFDVNILTAYTVYTYRTSSSLLYSFTLISQYVLVILPVIVQSGIRPVVITMLTLLNPLMPVPTRHRRDERRPLFLHFCAPLTKIVITYTQDLSDDTQ